MFQSSEKSIWRDNLVLSIEKFLSLVLPRNVIILQHLIIQFSLYFLLSGPLQEVKNKRKFQTFSSKSGSGCLQEVVAYNIDLETFGILEN